MTDTSGAALVGRGWTRFILNVHERFTPCAVERPTIVIPGTFRPSKDDLSISNQDNESAQRNDRTRPMVCTDPDRRRKLKFTTEGAHSKFQKRAIDVEDGPVSFDMLLASSL